MDSLEAQRQALVIVLLVVRVDPTTDASWWLGSVRVAS
jgi:hypothetical protein